MNAANTTNLIAIKRILLLAGLFMAAMALVGCGHNATDENPPASTNSMSDQQTPGSTITNNPAVTNVIATNSPAGTNQ